MNFIAQIVEANPFAAYGLAGLVIAWFMWFVDKLRNEIRGLAHRIDGLTRALLMDLVSRDSTGPHAKAMASEELRRIDARGPKE